jgi:hypothetical protein
MDRSAVILGSDAVGQALEGVSMSIRLHRVLWFIASLLAYYGGALAGVLLGALCVLPAVLLMGKEPPVVVGFLVVLLGNAALFAGLIGGARLCVRGVEALFLRHILPRCPGCEKETYPQAKSKPLTYCCPSCGHVTGTPAIPSATKLKDVDKAKGQRRGQARKQK